MRFKLGDRSTYVDIVGISDGVYHLLCACDKTFDRGIKSMTFIPTMCRQCLDAKAVTQEKTTVNGLVLRDLTAEEKNMIKDFLS